MSQFTCRCLCRAWCFHAAHRLTGFRYHRALVIVGTGFVSGAGRRISILIDQRRTKEARALIGLSGFTFRFRWAEKIWTAVLPL